MRNRAKCKLCQEIIESKDHKDVIDCKCGEISVMGGKDKMGCMAKNWDNFIRIDDEGNEIIPNIKEKSPPTKEELMSVLDEMIEKIEELPPMGMSTSLNHYDLVTLLYWLRAIFSVNAPKTEKQ